MCNKGSRNINHTKKLNKQKGGMLFTRRSSRRSNENKKRTKKFNLKSRLKSRFFNKPKPKPKPIIEIKINESYTKNEFRDKLNQSLKPNECVNIHDNYIEINCNNKIRLIGNDNINLDFGFIITNGTYIELENLMIDGNQFKQKAEEGLIIKGKNTLCKIRNCTIMNCESGCFCNKGGRAFLNSCIIKNNGVGVKAMNTSIKNPIDITDKFNTQVSRLGFEMWQFNNIRMSHDSGNNVFWHMWKGRPYVGILSYYNKLMNSPTIKYGSVAKLKNCDIVENNTGILGSNNSTITLDNCNILSNKDYGVKIGEGIIPTKHDSCVGTWDDIKRDCGINNIFEMKNTRVFNAKVARYVAKPWRQNPWWIRRQYSEHIIVPRIVLCNLYKLKNNEYYNCIENGFDSFNSRNNNSILEEMPNFNMLTLDENGTVFTMNGKEVANIEKDIMDILDRDEKINLIRDKIITKTPYTYFKVLNIVN